MIPLIDLQVVEYIKSGLGRLRKDEKKLDNYFSYASPKTIQSMRKLIQEYRIPVLNGFPRNETQLPCIIVQIGEEAQANYGLGDGIDENYPEQSVGDENYLHWTGEDSSTYVQENIQLSALLRIEVWSDNAVITSFLYAIVKYCLLSSKWQMVNDGLILPSIGGGDLEPAPDYLDNLFVYRRAILLNFDYVAQYHVADQIIGREPSHFPLETTVADIDIDINSIEEE